MSTTMLYVTAPNKVEAEKLARKIVELHLAGCVNILDSCRSIYMWEGKTCEENEVIMIIKTIKSKVGDLQSYIKKNHSYSVPCIYEVSVSSHNPTYAKWLEENCK